jgi:hypothetical protein
MSTTEQDTWITKVLGVRRPRIDMGPDRGYSLVEFAKARLAWQDAKGRVANLLAALREEIEADEGEDDGPVFAAATKKLDAVLARFNEGLGDTLDDLANAGEPGAIGSLKARAGKIVGDYLSYVDTSPLIAHLERNPYMPLGIAEALRKPLADVQARLAQ